MLDKEWEEYFKKQYLPKLIDILVILHNHIPKLEAYLRGSEGMYQSIQSGDWARLRDMKRLYQAYSDYLSKP